MVTDRLRRDRASRLRILCDFDGTITMRDVVDDILHALADAAWHDLENAWVAGRIGSRECLTGQLSLVRGAPSDIDAIADSIAIDPGFAAFVAWCTTAGASLEIVSDGLHDVICRILARHGLSLPVRANRLVAGRDGGWRLETPHAAPACKVDAAHCKCLSGGSSGLAGMTVVIGDGRSDICVAGGADFVLAREAENGPSTLLAYCRRRGLPHAAFAAFADVPTILASVLGERSGRLKAVMGRAR